MRNQKKSFMHKPWTKKSHATVPLSVVQDVLDYIFDCGIVCNTKGELFLTNNH
jgi:hypothetical protein